MIRPASPLDATAICAIYNPFVAASTISFEECAVSPEQMAERNLQVGATLPWLVMEIDGVLAGYAYATPWRVRPAYRRSVETSVYVAPARAGTGVATALYGALLADLRARGMHAVIAGIAQPNPASVALHERLGFRKVAHFSEVGFKLGRWVDVGYWELQLPVDPAAPA